MRRSQKKQQATPRVAFTFAMACALALSSVPAAALAEALETEPSEDAAAIVEQDNTAEATASNNSSSNADEQVQITEEIVEEQDPVVIEEGVEEGIEEDASSTSTVDIEEDFAPTLTAQSASNGPTVTHNVSNYRVMNNGGLTWDAPRASALHLNANGYPERVEYVDGQLVVETLAPSLLGIQNKQVIDSSTYLPTNCTVENMIWGGFYSGSTYNYVVTGQPNHDSNNNVAFMRITKYSKDWFKLGDVELTKNNTAGCDGVYEPFAQGSCVMLESGGQLHIRGSYENYNGHQASMHVVVNEATMKVTDSMVYVRNQNQTTYGGVSHSFGQRLTTLNGALYALDHGDAYPRELTIKKIGAVEDLSALGTVLTIQGALMDNITGVSLGGFEASGTQKKLVSAFASIDQSKFYDLDANAARNVFVGITDATPANGTKLTQLTHYGSNSTTGADMVKLVKVSEDRFLVMWAIMQCGGENSWDGVNQTGTVAYTFVDGKGQQLGNGKIYETHGYISDCEPMVYNNYVIWYAENVEGDHTPVYYSIDYTDGVASTPTEKGSVDNTSATISGLKEEPFTGSEICPEPKVVANGETLDLGSDYALSYANNVEVGTATITVQGINGYTGSQDVHFTIKEAQGTPTITAQNVSVAMGKNATIKASINSGAGKLSYKSTNTGVVKVDGTGKLTPVKVGSVTVIVTSAENAKWKSVSKSITVNVTKGAPAITAGNKTVVADKTLSIGAKVTSGAGKLSYKSANTGIVKVSAAGLITPVRAGKTTIAITAAANANWNSATKQITVTVKKAGQPLTVKATSKTARFVTVKRKATIVSPLTVSKAQGSVTYKKLSGSGALTVNATNGKVTVRKGTKRGTYTIKIRVTANGNVKYSAGSKDITAKVIVR